MATPIQYVKKDTAKLYETSNSDKVKLELLWGDSVQIVSEALENGRLRVNARWAKNAFIDPEDLGHTPLLELYFIDVGQGDGVLIVTPDRKHILIDGGYTREKQPHGKSAADFVDWKFFKEYGLDEIKLDAMISSHCDADHYGGLWDLLNPEKKDDLDTSGTLVQNFYHAGISWWTNGSRSRSLGNSHDGALINLLNDRDSILNGLDHSADLKLQGEWSQFLECIKDTGATVKRLSFNPEEGFNYLPEFEKDKPVSIKILGPIENNINGNPTLKDLGGDSQNTNGNSILLRVDFGKSRILLTGDLNLKSQQYIMESLAGHTQELAADVVKACHHGSDDCSFAFLQLVQAGATIISSGDDETHAHPRPNVVAASGATGFKKINGDKMVTPLVYSTEILRSIKLGKPYAVRNENYQTASGNIDVHLQDIRTTTISYKQTSSGALNPKDITKPMNKIKVVDGIVYGLVNVRTDGNRILCATLNEGKAEWDLKEFYSRF